MNCVTELSELQSVLPVDYLSVSCQKLNIVLMCVMPLMVPILRYIEHIRNFVMSSVKNVSVSLIHCMVGDIYFI